MYIGLQSMFYKYIWGLKAKRDQYATDTANKHMNLVCARRDSAAFQINVASEEEFVLTISESPLFWKEGAIKIARLELKLDAPIKTEIKLIGLMEDDDGQLKAEVLLDDSYIHVEKKRLQQVWVELHASKDIPTGQYTGTVRLYTHQLFEPERLTEELTFALNVLEDSLPDPHEYRFHLDLWQHNSNIARKYKVELWSDEHFRIIDGYLASLAALGQKALTVLVSEIPWLGQMSYMDRQPSDLYEYSMVKVTRRKNGTFDYDFTAMDNYVEIGFRNGICDEIEVFGLLNVWQDEPEYGVVAEGYPEAIRIRYKDESDGTYKFMRDSQEVKAYVRALAAHWKAKGWLDKVRILADEPADLQVFQRRVDTLLELVPSLKLKAAISHSEFIRQRARGVFDYVVIADCAAKEWDHLQELRSEVEGKLSLYVCCGPARPNTFIRSPSLEARLLPWLAEYLGFEGFLRWSYTNWPDRPLDSIVYRSSVFPAGDMNLVYPGPSGKPMLSLRYKWLLRGIRDYEYMQILKRDGKDNVVREAMQRVFFFEHVKEIYENKPVAELYSLAPEDYDRLYVPATINESARLI
ncbi:DUF4091 domain-containing protein [Cohnella phaseoli]|uniref:Uncharacterized protein DUF4091 n=1 Tax=Cohnella phaseoli TaxID=456490 RepID=A0A3D9JN41_9BACL|nr:DUF4091 domain-containing protein [Cohnella phaseoli]RED75219.1 uncharacterized protein DUF4091 [Cohnella phaseoli]